MDIAGAKKRKGRLDPTSADEDVPEGALPVYDWLGINPPLSEASREPEVEDPEARDASLFTRRGVRSRRRRLLDPGDADHHGHEVSPDALRLFGTERSAAAEVVRVVICAQFVPPGRLLSLGRVRNLLRRWRHL